MGSYQAKQWRPPFDLYVVMDYKYCRVWIRKSDKVQQYQEYPLELQNQRQLQQYQNMFALRLEQPYFPSTMFFINSVSKNICGGNKVGSILIQRIPLRLCQFRNIQYTEGISILYLCLKGYEILYKKEGLFKVKSTMVGFDQNYRIKLWYHTDLSSLYPEDPYCYTTYEMITSIVKSVQNILEQPQQIFRFNNYVERKKMTLYSFQMARRMLEQYLIQYDIILQNKFIHIERYLKESEGIIVPYKQRKQLIEKKSLENSQPFLIKSQSLGKYSFKKNRIVVEGHNRQSEEHRIRALYQSIEKAYYEKPKQKQKESVGRFQFQKSKQNMNRKYGLNTHQRNLQFQDESYIKNDQYGFHSQQIKYHSRTGSKFEKLTSKSTKQSEGRIKEFKSHMRSGSSNLTMINRKQSPSNPFSGFPELHEFQGMQSRSSSLKSLQSADSYSFIINGQSRPEIINMLRQKKR